MALALSATASISSWLRLFRMRLAPARARLSAAAFPSPDPAPVTSATLPSRSSNMFTSDAGFKLTRLASFLEPFAVGLVIRRIQTEEIMNSTDTHSLFITGLRDAHAMENQALSI